MSKNIQIKLNTCAQLNFFGKNISAIQRISFDKDFEKNQRVKQV